MTDANLVLGYLDPEAPLAGDVRLDRGAAERALAGAGRTSWTCRWRSWRPGIARVAATEMAQAARVVTVERGVDPRELALVSLRRRRRAARGGHRRRSWACRP